MSGKNLVLHDERPVQPPQLFADFSPLVTVFNSLGGVGAQTAGAPGGRTVGVVFGLGIGLCFHIFKRMFEGFAARAVEKIRRPRRVSFGLKTGWK